MRPPLAPTTTPEATNPRHHPNGAVADENPLERPETATEAAVFPTTTVFAVPATDGAVDHQPAVRAAEQHREAAARHGLVSGQRQQQRGGRGRLDGVRVQPTGGERGRGQLQRLQGQAEHYPEPGALRLVSGRARARVRQDDAVEAMTG